MWIIELLLLQLKNRTLIFHLYLPVGANKMVLVLYSAFSHPGPNSFIWLRPLELAPLSHVRVDPATGAAWRRDIYITHD